MSVKDFSESAKGFTKSPLGIIALFIVLVYGFASLVVAFGRNLEEHVAPLVYFLVGFPVVVFVGFLWLVANHHKKLYGPSDFKDEENFIKTQLSTAASLAVAMSKHTESEGDFDEDQFNEMVNLVSKTRKRVPSGNWKNAILWVDDRPDNNIHERKAFEEQGLHFKLALSTNQAINILKEEKFAAIISDMGREEGPDEGYVLLKKLRELGNKTPFVIYASSNLPEHKKLARENGALGSTNRVQELFELVMNAVRNGT